MFYAMHFIKSRVLAPGRDIRVLVHRLNKLDIARKTLPMSIYRRCSFPNSQCNALH
jgi:hypothetical protein